VIYLRVRACIKCKEYLPIHPSNVQSNFMLKEFEKKHSGHTVVTLELNEVKGEYQNAANKRDPKPASMEA